MALLGVESDLTGTRSRTDMGIGPGMTALDEPAAGDDWPSVSPDT
jgi:hypothetical protein